MSENAPSPEAFSHSVFIEIDNEWTAVEDAAQARELLTTRFPQRSGPSWTRALAASEAAIHGTGPLEMARVTLVVAAMEAGFRFEVIDDDVAAFERRIELEAENGLRSILDHSFDDPNAATE